MTRLVVLHGHDDDPATTRGWGRELAGEDELVVANGPVPLGSGRRAWFGEGRPGELDALCDALDEQVGATSERPVVLAGWSQGAAAALAYAMRGEVTGISGVIAIAGWLPDLEGLHWKPSTSVRVLALHGSDDEVVPVMAGRSAARFLERSGVEVTWHEFDAGHRVTAEMIEVATRWRAQGHSS